MGLVGQALLPVLAAPAKNYPIKKTRYPIDPRHARQDRQESLSYFAKSRCTTLDEYLCFCSVFFTDSAIITERCRPPVQPNAIVR